MQPYTKTDLRRGERSPQPSPGSPRSAATTAEEQALLFAGDLEPEIVNDPGEVSGEQDRSSEES